eukprot:scaffold3291_cov229-Pinguiococcus_pyrenoidosus.AAC.1
MMILGNTLLPGSPLWRLGCGGRRGVPVLVAPATECLAFPGMHAVRIRHSDVVASAFFPRQCRNRRFPIRFRPVGIVASREDLGESLLVVQAKVREGLVIPPLQAPRQTAHALAGRIHCLVGGGPRVASPRKQATLEVATHGSYGALLVGVQQALLDEPVRAHVAHALQQAVSLGDPHPILSQQPLLEKLGRERSLFPRRPHGERFKEGLAAILKEAASGTFVSAPNVPKGVLQELHARQDLPGRHHLRRHRRDIACAGRCAGHPVLALSSASRQQRRRCSESLPFGQTSPAEPGQVDAEGPELRRLGSGRLLVVAACGGAIHAKVRGTLGVALPELSWTPAALWGRHPSPQTLRRLRTGCVAVAVASPLARQCAVFAPRNPAHGLRLP